MHGAAAYSYKVYSHDKFGVAKKHKKHNNTNIEAKKLKIKQQF
jgi:hypothetical protein